MWITLLIFVASSRMAVSGAKLKLATLIGGCNGSPDKDPPFEVELDIDSDADLSTCTQVKYTHNSLYAQAEGEDPQGYYWNRFGCGGGFVVLVGNETRDECETQSLGQMGYDPKLVKQMFYEGKCIEIMETKPNIFMVMYMTSPHNFKIPCGVTPTPEPKFVAPRPIPRRKPTPKPRRKQALIRRRRSTHAPKNLHLGRRRNWPKFYWKPKRLRPKPTPKPRPKPRKPKPRTCFAFCWKKTRAGRSQILLSKKKCSWPSCKRGCYHCGIPSTYGAKVTYPGWAKSQLQIR